MKPEQLTFDRLEDRKAALGKRRLVKRRDECLTGREGHDWAQLADVLPGVVQYCRHCLMVEDRPV